MSDVMSDEALTRLGEATRLRRIELGLTQEELMDLGGPSPATVRYIEHASKEGFRPATLRSLERALQWPDGHADRILAGEANGQTGYEVTQIEMDTDPEMIALVALSEVMTQEERADMHRHARALLQNRNR